MDSSGNTLPSAAIVSSSTSDSSIASNEASVEETKIKPDLLSSPEKKAAAWTVPRPMQRGAPGAHKPTRRMMTIKKMGSPNNNNKIAPEAKSKTAPEDDKPKTNDAEKTTNNKSNSNNNNNTATPSGKRKSINLDDVQTFNIMFRNKQKHNGEDQGRGKFNHGFVWYRKLIETIRPAFRVCEIEGKSKICRWVIEKAKKMGGQFVVEDGSEVSEVYQEMDADDVLTHTLEALVDERPLTAIVGPSCIEENKEGDESLSKYLSQAISECGLKDDMLIKIGERKASLLDATNPAAADTTKTLPDRNSMGVDPALMMANTPNKKPKLDGETSNLLAAHSDRSDVVNELQQKERLQQFVQNYLREQSVLRGRMAENQEILLMRQERVVCLEREYKMLSERSIYVPPEQWIAERVRREEELFEHRELLAIQEERCRRLKEAMELNDRKMLERQMMLEKEKLVEEALRTTSTLSPSRNILHARKNGSETLPASKSTQQNPISILEQDIHREAGLLIDQQLAIDLEIKRRTVFEQQNAMEQELKYRLAMDHAKKRQAAMQQAMEERQMSMIQQNMAEMIRKRSMEVALWKQYEQRSSPSSSRVLNIDLGGTSMQQQLQKLPLTHQPLLPELNNVSSSDSVPGGRVIVKTEPLAQEEKKQEFAAAYHDDDDDVDDDDASIVI